MLRCLELAPSAVITWTIVGHFLGSILVWFDLSYIMESDLLICSVCPQQPDFSDVSHLLTHINSKGHLASLNRLSIKANSELAAAVQLASYNNWYQRHDIHNLLSERMVQKEAKTAIKKEHNVPTRRVKQEPVRVEVNLVQSSPTRQVAKTRARNKKRRARRQAAIQDEDSDPDYGPVKATR